MKINSSDKFNSSENNPNSRWRKATRDHLKFEVQNALFMFIILKTIFQSLKFNALSTFFTI